MSTGIEANVSEVFDAQILNQYVVVSQRAPRHCRQIIAVAQPPLCARKRQRECVCETESVRAWGPVNVIVHVAAVCVCVRTCAYVCVCGGVSVCLYVRVIRMCVAYGCADNQCALRLSAFYIVRSSPHARCWDLNLSNDPYLHQKNPEFCQTRLIF